MSTTTNLAPPGDWLTLPSDLPVPVDDGLADHLKDGTVEVPESMLLQATATSDGEGQGRENKETMVDLRELSFKKPVLVFAYPRTGRPGAVNPPGWDAIPGARGCTPELCSVRDTVAELRTAHPQGLYIFALSTQSPEYQSEVATRLHLPYPILSDASHVLSNALKLPTFEVDVEGRQERLLKRITLLINRGKVIGRDYPVFPTDQAAKRALEKLVRLLV